MPPTRKRVKSLSSGRPKIHKAVSGSRVSSKKGRACIRRHHALSKEHARLMAAGASAKAAEVQAAIEQNGGIEAYQKASRAGQSNERGGDTSRVLMDWLNDADAAKVSKLRMLEVGALEVDNACARSGLFEMTRIDLKSNDRRIEQQDFMQRPLPTSDSQRFDCISLSLVLNYVPDPRQRGEMLKRTIDFLRKTTDSAGFPAVFFVLPSPCVTNSRYMDEERMEAIFHSLGFSLSRKKLTSKLTYQLWRLDASPRPQAFPKSEINPGKQRNNFTVIVT